MLFLKITAMYGKKSWTNKKKHYIITVKKCTEKKMRCFSYAGGKFELGKKTYIMGILNITPDSFSDGNLWIDPKKAVAHAVEMEENGADIIDVGAFSTRPGADNVPPSEEWRRLSSVLPAVLEEVKIPVSVDTFVTETAQRCLDAGAAIINDVSGVFNGDMARLIKKYGAGWIMMHGGVSTGRTESVVSYPNGVVGDVQLFFDRMTSFADNFGIDAEKICFDPGFGFSKNTVQNTQLLKNLSSLDTHGRALLSALSRKRFVGALCGEPNPEQRDEATLACDILSAIGGADIVRVHNVKIHAAALRAADGLIR